VAVSLCAGSFNALSLHGFQPGPPDLSTDDQVVLVGGGDTILAGYLLEGLRKAGFDARDAGRRGTRVRDRPWADKAVPGQQQDAAGAAADGEQAAAEHGRRGRAADQPAQRRPAALVA
jgi:hypothetical protein